PGLRLVRWWASFTCAEVCLEGWHNERSASGVARPDRGDAIMGGRIRAVVPASHPRRESSSALTSGRTSLACPLLAARRGGARAVPYGRVLRHRSACAARGSGSDVYVVGAAGRPRRVVQAGDGG